MERLFKFKSFLQEFSIPLIAGVVLGVVYANVDEHAYHHLLEFTPFGPGISIFGHPVTFHFLVNDIFMVLFFGVAAKEITESVLPGGALNPMKKAINPLLGTIGGVIGPAVTYTLLTAVLFSGHPDQAVIAGGWGIPTATDIALAWLVARMVFGARHPAVNFLLLLAVADDAIGLGIIAIFYPDPFHPVQPLYLALTAGGMAIAFGLRKMNVKAWYPYIFVAGVMSWAGLLLASLHPALALVFIVPFLPGPKRDTGLFAEDDDIAVQDGHDHGPHHSTLHNFEHGVKWIVDFGLLFFGFANAGVAFASVNVVTWIVLCSLAIGKVVGISTFSMIGNALGFSLPQGMKVKHLVVASIVAGLGLTVALFVAGQAFPAGSPYQGPAKMGAVFSAGIALLAIAAGRIAGVRDAAIVAAEPRLAPAAALTPAKDTLYSHEHHAGPGA